MRGTLLGFASTSTSALLPLIARDILKGGPVGYGIMMGGFGAGALAAGLMNPRLRQTLTQERLVVLACLACALCEISLALTSSLAIATVCLALGGAGWVTAWSGLGVNVQLASPRWIVGRTISIYSAFTYGGIAGGSWFWGAIVQTYSLPSAMAWSAVATLGVAALGFNLPISNRSESELEPAGAFCAPAIALDLKPRSGPILVMTEYTIVEEDLDLFLQIMQKRRHVQSRVGARQWTLTRDIQQPTRWVESFRTPTWTDYHRLHHRLTEADRELGNALLQLTATTNPPRTSILVERPAAARASRIFRWPICRTNEVRLSTLDWLAIPAKSRKKFARRAAGTRHEGFRGAGEGGWRSVLRRQRIDFFFNSAVISQRDLTTLLTRSPP